MTITVEIPRVLQPFAGGSGTVRLVDAGGTVRDALDALARTNPGVIDRVMTEQRLVREHVNLFVDEENVRFLAGLDTPIRDGSTITILAAVSGG